MDYLMEIKTFSQLKKNLSCPPPAESSLKMIRIALLGDSATQFLSQAIRGLGIDRGFDFQMWEADFNQIERQLFDPASELYEFKPEIVIVFQSTHKLLGKYNKLEQDQRAGFAAVQAGLIEKIHDEIQSSLKANVVFYNFPEIDDSVFGNYANKLETSFLFQLRDLNVKLMLLASRTPSFHLCDLSAIQNRVGKDSMFQPSIYVNTEMVLTIDVLPAVAARTLDLVGAMQGKVRKCLILDLDNTLWGGVIGDDGLESIQLGTLGIGKAFTEFQYWIKKLKDRGIVLAVCSKNSEFVAKEPFEKHPDMVLHLDDISVFVANWENKVDNIRLIQQTLNIGFDSMVFLDDNPAERSIVRENIQEITVPELPEDPADYLEHLYSLNLFETLSYSSEDAMRTRLYQVEVQRTEFQGKFTNETGFLESLNMVSMVEPFTKFNTPRVAQLSQRSNQFNLRTIRHSESEIAAIADDSNWSGFAFTLEDKFGDNGMVCAVILKRESETVLFIDTWFMSCRVLKRGMENFVLNTLVEFAKEAGSASLVGEFIPTLKNEMVKDHYLDLGFLYVDGRWNLDVSGYQTKKTFINKKSVLRPKN
jgi:FkbH-like protein